MIEAHKLTTISFFRFGRRHRPWAMSQMAFAHRSLKAVGGLEFYKLLGSGGGAFGVSARPDFSTWALLAVWEDSQFERAFRFSPTRQAFAERAKEQWTVHLRPYRSHGRWSGAEPFGHPEPVTSPVGPIAVITRASIRRSLVPRFWTHVPPVNASMEGADGLLFSKGIGELPFVEQGTFSVWRSAADMSRFAYENAAHRDVIARTRALDWYSEELFARFLPMKSEGTWEGNDPLADQLADLG